MAQTEIMQFSLSATWVKVNLTLLERKPSVQAPMAFLGRFTGYKQAFHEAQYQLEHYQNVLSLGTPWIRRRQLFWMHYLNTAEGNVKTKPDKAWKGLVPFRTELPVTPRGETVAYQPQLELFFYPYGVASVVTLTFWAEESLSLQEMAEQARSMRHNQNYPVTWVSDSSPEIFGDVAFPEFPPDGPTLNHLGESALEIAHAAAFGPEASEGKRTAIDPFTVFTILHGDIEEGMTLTDNNEIHKTLHAVTTWQGMLDVSDPVSMSNIGLGEEANPEHDILYGQNRARAVWYPKRFASSDPQQIFSLTCYHRNLTLASMQTESMCGLAEAVVEQLRIGRSLPSRQRELSRFAAGNLGRLYGGHHETYRSLSIPRQIEDNHWEEPVNFLRDYWGMESLHT